MVQIAISNLPPLPPITGSGTPLGTDLIPGVDTSDLTESLAGTTKKYTRAASFNYELEALGLTTYTAVLAASTGALTATYDNGTLGVGATLTNAGAQVALTLDGVTLTLGDRVLIKDQVSTFQNGIYFVSVIGSASSNWVLIRALDYNQAADIVQYGVMLVNAGTVNQSTLYQEVSPGPFLMGTTAITFARFQAGAISLPVSLANGGTGASLTASNGGIFYSNASTGVILAGTATAAKMLQSGSSSAPSWSTATWPTTTSVSQLLYSSTSNNVTGLATVQGGTLTTNSALAPEWLANPSATGRYLRSVSGDSATWSTASLADTFAVSEILYASSSNAVSGLATANNGILSTNASGVPAINTTVDFVGQFNVDNLRLDGNTIEAMDVGGNITLIADGTGNVDIFAPPASESSSITVNGVAFNAAFRVNDIGTTSPAQSIVHRHSTTLEPVVLFARSNSDTDAHAAVTNGMALSSTYSSGWTGAQYSLFGQIRISADGTGTINNTSAPGKLDLMVSPDGAITPVAALSINNTGLATLSNGLSFSSTAGIIGTTTNNNAAAGSVGQLVSSVITSGSAVSLTTATPANIASISLPAGDWDVWANASFIPAATTNVVQARGWISATSATQPDSSLYSGVQNAAAGIVPADTFGFCVPSFRVSLATPTTYYLSCTSAFTVDTLAACGALYARVRR